MEQALNELGDMIRKQQQLRDKTFKQGQDLRRDRMRGKQGDQSMGDLQQDQQALRDRLKRLQEELAKRGMGPASAAKKASAAKRVSKASKARASKGRATAIRATARMGSTRPMARWAMPAAGSARAMPTVPWTRRAARWMPCARAPRTLRKRCSRVTATRPATARATASAGSRAAATRPIRSAGRLHGREYGDDLTVKIPGEIDVQRVRRILEELRRRLADPGGRRSSSTISSGC